MITAPPLYALGYGDARTSLARIVRWTQFLGVLGLIMIGLAVVAAVPLLLLIDGVPKLPFVLMLVFAMTAAVPSYFMITTARAFRSVPERATLTHFARPFAELRRLLQWLLVTFLLDLAVSALFVIMAAADPSLALLMTGGR